MLGRGIEISKSKASGGKPVTKVEVSRGLGAGRRPRRRAKLSCPLFKGGRRC